MVLILVNDRPEAAGAVTGVANYARYSYELFLIVFVKVTKVSYV
jgi:hypothetical protein